MTDSFIQFPQIDPIIFSIGPVAIRWYGLMYLIGFVAALYIANRAADNSKGLWNREQVSDLLFYGFLGVILGGRLGYVFFYQFEHLLAEPSYLIRIWEGGMSFHGGLLGVIFAVFLFAKKTKKSFLTVGDFVAPLVPIGLGMGRIGNFMNAELWGRETNVPWAMIFPNDPMLLPRHPSQLYQSFLEGFILFLLVYFVAKKSKSLGMASGTFLIGYGVFRLISEFFREPDAHLGFIFSFISMGQILSLPMVMVGIAIIIYGKKQTNKTAQNK